MSMHRIPTNPERQPTPLSVAAGSLFEACYFEAHHVDWSEHAQGHFTEAAEHLLAAVVSLKRAEGAVPAPGGTTA